MMALVALLLSTGGFAFMAVSMHKHYRQVFVAEPTKAGARARRITAWLLLGCSLAVAVVEEGAPVGIVLWTGVLTVGALSVTLLLSHRPRTVAALAFAAPLLAITLLSGIDRAAPQGFVACRVKQHHLPGLAVPEQAALAPTTAHELAVPAQRHTGTAEFGETYGGGGKGIIDSQEAVGGWPELEARAAPPDTDGEGMPNAWESAHRLDPHDVADGAKDHDGDGYTNLEEYLNGTDPTVFVNYKKPENNVNTLQTEEHFPIGKATVWNAVSDAPSVVVRLKDGAIPTSRRGSGNHYLARASGKRRNRTSVPPCQVTADTFGQQLSDGRRSAQHGFPSRPRVSASHS